MVNYVVGATEETDQQLETIICNLGTPLCVTSKQLQLHEKFSSQKDQILENLAENGYGYLLDFQESSL